MELLDFNKDWREIKDVEFIEGIILVLNSAQFRKTESLIFNFNKALEGFSKDI
jgi:hypothetical protein